MAGISMGDNAHGKKSVDTEIPLIPFIDLLLCCVMFLLVTAVWNHMSSMEANLNSSADPAAIDTPPPEPPLTVLIDQEGYRLSGAAGDEVRIPLAAPGVYDEAALAVQLERRHVVDPSASAALLSADDGVNYALVIGAMDVLVGSGFSGVTITGTL
ncbi:MAG TPA: biopolymer transporter ExbD [Polyangiaceae bacterium]|nr:biopolymer transporter ExbD [Polyangiaceae bacterium]